MKKIKNLCALFIAAILSIFFVSNSANGMDAKTRAMERYSFDTFDPEMMNGFDPEVMDSFDDNEDGFNGYDYENSYDDPEADGYRGRKKTMNRNMMAQVDITIDNTQQAATQTVELFNYLKSFTTIRNSNIDATKLPFTADNIISAAALSTANLANNRIYWNNTGDLILQGASAAVFCKISCAQVPYRTLFESSSRNPFAVSKLRLTYSNAAQIDQTITHFQYSFLGGIKENNISPRSYFDPRQQQSLIVDVTQGFTIDQEKGIRYTMNANQSVTVNLFITRFSRSASRP